MDRRKVSSLKSNPKGQSVKVTLKGSSGEIWIETEPLSVRCTMADIVFVVARVDRLGTDAPYLFYEEKVQPYWKPLLGFKAVRNGCQALEMTITFEPKESPIRILFDKVKPINEDDTDMSFDTFKKCVTDPEDELYMDMERLMNNIYPPNEAYVEKLWRWKLQVEAEV